MKPLFFWLFSPGWNRYIVWGTALTIVGIILTPVIIGLPLMGFGFGLFSIGVMASILNKFPKGRLVVSEFEKMFAKMFRFVKAIIQEAR